MPFSFTLGFLVSTNTISDAVHETIHTITQKIFEVRRNDIAL